MKLTNAINYLDALRSLLLSEFAQTQSQKEALSQSIGLIFSAEVTTIFTLYAKNEEKEQLLKLQQEKADTEGILTLINKLSQNNPQIKEKIVEYLLNEYSVFLVNLIVEASAQLSESRKVQIHDQMSEIKQLLNE